MRSLLSLERGTTASPSFDGMAVPAVFDDPSTAPPGRGGS